MIYGPVEFYGEYGKCSILIESTVHSRRSFELNMPRTLLLNQFIDYENECSSLGLIRGLLPGRVPLEKQAGSEWHYQGTQ